VLAAGPDMAAADDVLFTKQQIQQST